MHSVHILCLSFILIFEVCEAKIVRTSYGELRGATGFSFDNNHKHIFRGVPFAKPPVGRLRFAVPEEPDSWNGILDATKDSAACISKADPTRMEKNVSENCLYINIYTSDKCLTSPCSVIMFFHGGGFNIGSGMGLPEKFILERYVSEDVVFVAPNYRLGVFGQLYFGADLGLTENLLMFDAVEALKYVHNEIRNFGGDPNSVTLIGHSSGGTMIDAIAFSSLVDPEKKLFQQIIVLSGPGSFDLEELAIESSFMVAEKLKCFSGDRKHVQAKDVTEILDCLRKLKSSEISEMQQKVSVENNVNFTRIVKGAPFMQLNGKLVDLRSNSPARNAIFGTTESEFVKYNYVASTFMDVENPLEVLKYYDENVKNDSSTSDFRFGSDSVSIFYSTATSCESMVNAGSNVYLFETRQEPISNHVSDLQYFLGIRRENNRTSDMDILDSFYSKFLVRFAKFGKPTPLWEKYDPVRMNFLNLEFNTEKGIWPRMENDYHRVLVNFWNNDMIEVDKQITEKKLNSQKMKKTVRTAYSIDPDAEKKREAISSIHTQHWFYIGTIFAISAIVALFIFSMSSKTEENTPLI